MKTHHRRVFQTFILFASVLCLASPLKGQRFVFSKLAESSAFYGDLSGPLSMNDNGLIIFTSLVGDIITHTMFFGTQTAQRGLFLPRRAGTPPRLFGPVVINNADRIAYTQDGSPVITSSLFGTSVITIGGGPFPVAQSINDAGTVLVTSGFPAQPTTARIVIGNGGPLTTIASALTQFGSFTSFSMNDKALVAFSATLQAGGSGVFLGDGTSTVTIADSTTDFSSFGSVSINDHDSVAFRATLTDGVSGIFTADGTSIRRVVDTTGAFSGFGGVSINRHGSIAFNATLDTGGAGIFVSRGAQIEPVIAVEDALFGSIVRTVILGRGWFNDKGQLAFKALLWDGRYVLVRAEPIFGPPYGLYLRGGSYFTNYRGQQEKYFGGISSRNGYCDPDGYWYYILPNGDLYEFTPPYSSSALTGVLVAQLGAAYYNNPGWLTYSLYQRDGSYFTNYRGQQEKYFGGTASANGYDDPNGYWYFVLPSGGLYEFTPPYSNPELTGVLVARLGTALYDRPALVPPRLHQHSGGYFTGFRGQQEKYLRGLSSVSGYDDPSGYWYYILPNGALYEFTPPYSNPALSGVLVQQVGASLYNDPSPLLTDGVQIPAEEQ